MASLSTPPTPGSLLQGVLLREHGVWFQLGLPLATALFVSGAPLSALLLSGAALACLLAHEPLLLLPVILGGEVLLLAWKRQERTLAGEVLAALALSAWAVPIAMAGGLPASTALTLWGTYGLSFGLATLAVRTVIASHRPHAHRERLRCTGAALVTALLATAILWALASGLHPLRVLALLPVGLVALGLCVALPSPRQLHAIGWTLGVAGTLTLVLLGVGLS